MEQSAGTCLSSAAGMDETEQPAGRRLKPLLSGLSACQRTIGRDAHPGGRRRARGPRGASTARCGSTATATELAGRRRAGAGRRSPIRAPGRARARRADAARRRPRGLPPPARRRRPHAGADAHGARRRRRPGEGARRRRRRLPGQAVRARGAARPRARAAAPRARRRARAATLRFADLVLDPGRYTVHRGGRPLELTRTEFALLELFLRNPRQVLTRSLIFERVWGYDFGPASNSLEVYVGYLRRKTGGGGRAAAAAHGARRRLRPARAMSFRRRLLLACAAAVAVGRRARAPCSPTSSCATRCAGRSTIRCARPRGPSRRTVRGEARFEKRSAPVPGAGEAGDVLRLQALQGPVLFTQIFTGNARPEDPVPGGPGSPASAADLRALAAGRRDAVLQRARLPRHARCGSTRARTATARSSSRGR